MIYLDNSATTPAYREVIQIVERYSCDNFYNPSALYNRAASVRQDINLARAKMLKLLGASGGSLIFTASGTEADNMALLGGKRFKNGRIIISATEHAAINNTAKKLAEQGYELSIAPVDRYGRVIISELENLLDKDTMLVSVMHVSNETGAVNDIAKISQLIKSKSPRAIFHSDGVQAVGKTPVNLSRLGVDMYSISGHKFHAQKGIGALYIRQGLHISPIIFGGGQEGGLRSATENVSGIVSMAYALERTLKEVNYNENKAKIDELAGKLLQINPDFIINTDLSHSCGSILSLSVPDTRGEVLLHMLEDNGVIIGSGSACSASKGSKRIPEALGLDKRYHDGMLRISISHLTTQSDIEEFIRTFDTQYNLLRSYMSR